jgi:hypothetical protein
MLTRLFPEPFPNWPVPIHAGGLQFPVPAERHQALFGLGAFCVSDLLCCAWPKETAPARPVSKQNGLSAVASGAVLRPPAGHWAKCRPVGGLAFGDRIADC